MSRFTEQEVASSHEALPARMSLLRGLDDDFTGLAMAMGLMGLQPWDDPNYWQRWNADRVRTQVISMVAESEMFLAPIEMCRILDLTAQAFPTPRTNLADILVPQGMTYFEQPLADPGPGQPRCPIRAISWSVDRGGSPSIEHLPIDANEYLISLVAYTETKFVPGIAPSSLSHLPRMYPWASTTWMAESNKVGVLWDSPELQKWGQNRVEFMKIAKAFWALMKQRRESIADTDSSTLNKQMKRKVSNFRKHRPNFSNEVRIIRMNRKSGKPRARQRFVMPDDPEELFNAPPKIERDFQWGVRPFWRALKDPVSGMVRDTVLVNGHFRGPENKPVKGANRIYLPPKPKE